MVFSTYKYAYAHINTLYFENNASSIIYYFDPNSTKNFFLFHIQQILQSIDRTIRQKILSCRVKIQNRRKSILISGIDDRCFRIYNPQGSSLQFVNPNNSAAIAPERNGSLP